MIGKKPTKSPSPESLVGSLPLFWDLSSVRRVSFRANTSPQGEVFFCFVKYFLTIRKRTSKTANITMDLEAEKLTCLKMMLLLVFFPPDLATVFSKS
jgi:hypothetical protein